MLHSRGRRRKIHRDSRIRCRCKNQNLILPWAGRNVFESGSWGCILYKQVCLETLYESVNQHAANSPYSGTLILTKPLVMLLLLFPQLLHLGPRIVTEGCLWSWFPHHFHPPYPLIPNRASLPHLNSLKKVNLQELIERKPPLFQSDLVDFLSFVENFEMSTTRGITSKFWRIIQVEILRRRLNSSDDTVSLRESRNWPPQCRVTWDWLFSTVKRKRLFVYWSNLRFNTGCHTVQKEVYYLY